MNRVWRQLAIVSNWPILAAVAILSALGTLSIWADTPDQAARQLIFLAVSLACMLLLQGMSYLRSGRWAWAFYLASLVLIVYTIVPATHVESTSNALFRVPKRNGAYGWINCGPMALQPAELTKIAFILVLARYLRFRSNYRTLTGLLPPFLLAMIPTGLILLQPDLGTALVFIPALFAMLFVAGARMRHLMVIVSLGVALAPIMWLSGMCREPGCTICPSLPVLRHLPQFVKHYQRARVYSLFSDDPDVLQGTGFQQERALIALGSGGVLGKGFGTVPVGKHVPEAHNDMIFALIGEQFGLLGSAVVLGAYLILFAAGIEVASKTREPFGRLIAVGIVSLLAGQTFLNLAVCMRLMPVTGITLPFVSYGGSSLLASYIAVGLLLNVGQNRPLVMARDSFEFG
jgi:cell division protein FtsW (lipid II flippase)